MLDASLRYPERASLSVLKHSEHPLVQLHRAVELGQVGIVDLLELRRREQLQHLGSRYALRC